MAFHCQPEELVPVVSLQQRGVDSDGFLLTTAMLFSDLESSLMAFDSGMFSILSIELCPVSFPAHPTSNAATRKVITIKFNFAFT